MLFRSEPEVWKSFRNLGDHVQIILPEELAPYDVLVNDWIVSHPRRSIRPLAARGSRHAGGAKMEVQDDGARLARRRPEARCPARLTR